MCCGFNVVCLDSLVIKFFIFMLFKCLLFDYGFEDSKDFGFGGGFEEGFV